MGKKQRTKAARLLLRYREEEEKKKNSSQSTAASQSTTETSRDALDRARFKLFETSQYFLKDFIPRTTADGKGPKGKIKLIVQRLFRKCTLYIFTQLAERILNFQTRSLETSGELYRAMELQEEQCRADHDELQTLRQQFLEEHTVLKAELQTLREQMEEQHTATVAEDLKIYQKIEEQHADAEAQLQELRRSTEEIHAAAVDEDRKIYQKIEEQHADAEAQLQELKHATEEQHAAAVDEDWKIYQKIEEQRADTEAQLQELKHATEEQHAAAVDEDWKIYQKIEAERQTLQQQIQENRETSTAEDWKIYQKIEAEKQTLQQQIQENRETSTAEDWKIYQKIEAEKQTLQQQIQENKETSAAEDWKIYQKIGAENQTLQQQIQENKEASAAEEWKIHQKIGTERAELQHHLDEQQRVIGAAARDLMRTKWQLRDHLAEKTDLSGRMIRCGICGYEAKEGTFKTVETDCIFAGGHLKRYECPECGCIFGPLKFRDQTESEFNDDYTVHYAGFFETDCTWKERWAFELLHPSKNGVYLDYGCGKWSHTIRELREEGYEVWGYEPYAADVDNPYIITDRETLEKMRFDGIFSNDLLEHLADPVADMKFMAGLLRGADSRIAHNTSCYAYKYEFTRFHMYFFTGRSVQVLAERAGLQVVGCVDELETKDLYCNIFAPKEGNNA